MLQSSDNTRLGKNGELWKAILDAHHDAMILTDDHGKILQVNRKVRSMLGFDEKEILGRAIQTIIPEVLAMYPSQSQLPGVDNPSEKEDNDPDEGRIMAAIRKNHSEVYVNIRLSTVQIGNEKLTAAFIQEIRVKEILVHKFHQMVDEIQDHSIVFLNVNGEITQSNKGVERIMGYNANDLTRKNYRLFFSDDDQNSFKPEKLLEKAGINARTEHECWLKRKDGSVFLGSVILAASYDSSNRVLGYLKITRDLSEKLKIEQMIRAQADELQAKNKELENFAYIASHDLQEPLSTITSMIGLIREESKVPFSDDINLYFSFIEEASERMRNLIIGLLNYSRLGRKKELTNVNLQDVVDDVQADLGHQISLQKALIEVMDPLPEIQAYAAELQLVLQNIISNSLKFRSPLRRPHVKVHLSDESDYWKFSIEDNGIGIREKFLTKIFIIFQQLNEKSLYEGDGIGLAHCKKIVDMHEGDIWAASEFGKGTTIHFTISKNIKTLSEVAEKPEVAFA